MNQAIFLFTMVSAFFGQAIVSCGQESRRDVKVPITSRNSDFATLLNQLLNRSDVRDAIGVTEEQVQALTSVWESMEYKRFERASFTADEVGDKYMILDKQAREILASALSDSQIVKLRRWAFFSRYGKDFSSILRDAFVLRYVGVQPSSQWTKLVK